MSAPNLVGRRLGGFVVERELGAGGMGMVVLARQQSLDRPAVLKRIHPQYGADPELEQRFDEVRRSSEEEWPKLRHNVETAWKDITDGFARAWNRFG